MHIYVKKLKNQYTSVIKVSRLNVFTHSCKTCTLTNRIQRKNNSFEQCLKKYKHIKYFVTRNTQQCVLRHFESV